MTRHCSINAFLLASHQYPSWLGTQSSFFGWPISKCFFGYQTVLFMDIKIFYKFLLFSPHFPIRWSPGKRTPWSVFRALQTDQKNCRFGVIDFSRLWQKNHFVPVRSGFTDFLKFSRLSVCRAQKSSQNRFLRLLCGFQDKTLGSIFTFGYQIHFFGYQIYFTGFGSWYQNFNSTHVTSVF